MSKIFKILIFTITVLFVFQGFSQTYKYEYNGKISMKKVYGDNNPKIDFIKHPVIVTIEIDKDDSSYRILTIDLGDVGEIKAYISAESSITTLNDYNIKGDYSQGMLISQGTPTVGVLISDEHLLMSVGGEQMVMMVFTNNTSFFY